ncbi:phosphoglycerate dehydrogenase [Schleiferiaceae bacterium]|nr:phosphoglycerate dehydrogenase [Schleiferiaceae bacterium]
MKILLTSTSFQDAPGKHHDLINNLGYDIVKMRGPLKEVELLKIITDFDCLLCGDDEITYEVIRKGSEEGNLKIISKYGIGLDKIDLKAAKKFNISVTNCPGVNKSTVAEHVFALILSFVKNIVLEDNLLKSRRWERLIGTDLAKKTLGVLGTGNIGKEVIKKAKAFDMKVVAFDKYPDHRYAKINGFVYENSFENFLQQVDILTIHVMLSEETKNLIDVNSIKLLRSNCIIVNTARSEIVNQESIISALNNNLIGGYLCDVFQTEPLEENDPILSVKNVILTPHIGSRTYENAERQGLMAVENLIKSIGEYEQI